ncbi:unnamed protein product [Triticum turgidum subsp. durum]|uniref:Uncharacterized protein n=1 Tax=Triticum turgidum subsp. durum TaxID=4567 RepID=A0A9R0YX11_TRITD|nr:unnamed protein product [Triticum turgidum subsp. durum]
MAGEKVQFAIPMAAGEKEQAKVEKEAALKAKAGCGSKRRAEEDREEAPAAVGVKVQWNGEDESEDELYKACMAEDSFDYDSDDSLDVYAAKYKALFERFIEACDARCPWLVGKSKVANADADESLLV